MCVCLWLCGDSGTCSNVNMCADADFAIPPFLNDTQFVLGEHFELFYKFTVGDADARTKKMELGRSSFLIERRNHSCASGYVFIED
eukprot:3022105-Amphidinium_carterae.1